MRRTILEPPRPILGSPAVAPVWTDGSERGEPLSRGVLEAPAAARERRRPLFHPRRGHFRRLERRVSCWLSARVYPRVPGMQLPYDRTLRRELTLSETEISLAGLDPRFEGLRVLLISDPHAGPFVSPRVLHATFERLLALEPDLLLVGGDLVTTRIEELEQNRAAFAALRAPLGVYAVLGNHDHYTGQPERMRGMLEDLGIRVLHNRSATIERDGGALALAGVDDMLLGKPDLRAALAGTAGPVVLLSHNPDLFFEAARHDVALMLSGHTHGGQIRLPRLPVLVRQSRYRLDAGRYRSGETELVVSRGIGAVGLPVRWACPPEAVLIRLRRAEPA